MLFEQRGPQFPGTAERGLNLGVKSDLSPVVSDRRLSLVDRESQPGLIVTSADRNWYMEVGNIFQGGSPPASSVVTLCARAKGLVMRCEAVVASEDSSRWRTCASSTVCANSSDDTPGAWSASFGGDEVTHTGVSMWKKFFTKMSPRKSQSPSVNSTPSVSSPGGYRQRNARLWVLTLTPLVSAVLKFITDWRAVS